MIELLHNLQIHNIFVFYGFCFSLNETPITFYLSSQLFVKAALYKSIAAYGRSHEILIALKLKTFLRSTNNNHTIIWYP